MMTRYDKWRLITLVYLRYLVFLRGGTTHIFRITLMRNLNTQHLWLKPFISSWRILSLLENCLWWTWGNSGIPDQPLTPVVKTCQNKVWPVKRVCVWSAILAGHQPVRKLAALCDKHSSRHFGTGICEDKTSIGKQIEDSNLISVFVFTSLN